MVTEGNLGFIEHALGHSIDPTASVTTDANGNVYYDVPGGDHVGVYNNVIATLPDHGNAVNNLPELPTVGNLPELPAVG